MWETFNVRPRSLAELLMDEKLYPRTSIYAEPTEFVIDGFYEDEMEMLEAELLQILKLYMGATFPEDVVVQEVKKEQVAVGVAEEVKGSATDSVEEGASNLDSAETAGTIGAAGKEVLYRATASLKTWTMEELHKQTPQQIVDRALNFYVTNRADRDTIKELSEATDDRLIILAVYLQEPELFQQEVDKIRASYTATCPKCQKVQLLSGYRRDFLFWKTVREERYVNHCRCCGESWEIEE